MPTYDYECRSCGYEFETFQSIVDDPLKDCPECGKDHLRRLIGGGAGIIFKGSGFYINDSRNSSSGSPPSTNSSPSSESATPSPAADKTTSGTSADKKKESA